MNPYRSTDLAKSYRANDIDAADARRRREAAERRRPTAT